MKTNASDKPATRKGLRVQRLVRLCVRPPGEWPWRVASALIPPAMLIPWPWAGLYIACVFGYAILTARAPDGADGKTTA